MVLQPSSFHPKSLKYRSLSSHLFTGFNPRNLQLVLQVQHICSTLVLCKQLSFLPPALSSPKTKQHKMRMQCPASTNSSVFQLSRTAAPPQHPYTRLDIKMYSCKTSYILKSLHDSRKKYTNSLKQWNHMKGKIHLCPLKTTYNCAEREKIYWSFRFPMIASIGFSNFIQILHTKDIFSSFAMLELA